MKRINIESWKEFKIGELFDIHPTKHYNDENGKALSNAKLFNEEGINPVVVNSSYNNGIGGYTTLPCNEKGGIITFSDTTTTDAIFYQEHDFVGYSHIQGMYPKQYLNKWNKYSMKFFEVAFQRGAISLGYNYVNKFTREYAKAIKVRLPSIDNENPDFEYMETYMKEIEKIASEKLMNLTQIISGGYSNRITTTLWEEFSIGDILDIKKPAVYHTRQVIEASGGIPYIVRSKFNNGLKYRAIIKNNEKAKIINPKHVISFGSENSSFFYQNEEWISGRDIYYIDTRKYSINTCLFLISCLQKLARKYDYNNGLFPNVLRKEKIKLPATKSHLPDWQYMDSYMKTIKAKGLKIEKFNLL